MIVAIISTCAIAVLLIGLAAMRYYTRRKNQANNSSDGIIKYWRRQLTLKSSDNLTPLTITNDKQWHRNVQETKCIVKNSFSWSGVSILHQQNQEQNKYFSTISSSSLSYSSTVEYMFKSASLTFGLRWSEITQSLFVRVISAENLFIHRLHRQPLIIDSYVRIELVSTSSENNNRQSKLVFFLCPSLILIHRLICSFLLCSLKKHVHQCVHILLKKMHIQSMMNYLNLPILNRYTMTAILLLLQYQLMICLQEMKSLVKLSFQ